MRILVLADLHLEFWLQLGRDPLGPLRECAGSIDALIVAGDIANDPLRNWPAAIAWLGRFVSPEKIWLMAGNHDYYGFHLDGDEALRRIASEGGANFLQKDVLELGGVRFLCCTLWSDFALRGMTASDMAAAQRSMNDYRLIARADGNIAQPADTLAIHHDHLAWLRCELARPHGDRTVVVTHHAPSARVSGPLDVLSPAFGSNLDALVMEAQPDLWLCGHTHRRHSAMIGRTKIRNVSLGYPMEVDAWAHSEILNAGLIETSLPGGRLLAVPSGLPDADG